MAIDDQLQGRWKLPEGGVAALLDQSCDAAKGSDIDIELCKYDNSARSTGKIFFAFIFSYLLGH